MFNVCIEVIAVCVLVVVRVEGVRSRKKKRAYETRQQHKNNVDHFLITVDT